MVERNVKGGTSGTLKDAEEELKKGEKEIKTGVFKWSADYLGAVSHFQKAGQLFKQLGLKDKAVKAYLKYSFCSEKINELYGAADGLVEAAFCESNKDQSLEYLSQALNFYKINDNAKEGIRNLKTFAQQMLESENASDRKKALDIYESLFKDVFEGDNYIWNPEIVNEYLSVLVQNEEYARALEAKKQFIRFLKKDGKIDHQIRRAYLEIICIQILAEDYYRIQNTLESFEQDVGGNAYNYDEYDIGCKLKSAVEDKDYKKILELSKKPIFGFLEVEIVKKVKMFAMNPPNFNQPSEGNDGKKEVDHKKKVLDNLLI